MANKKEYSIVINGVKQAISEVDSLISKIQYLDQRIQAMSRNSAVKLNTNGGTSTAQLKEQDNLLKQIQKTEEQIANAKREEYQSLLAQKDVLKEVTEDAKTRAAQERLAAEAYTNTMAGMKAQLADIKRVMNTTDVSDDAFKKMSDQANELNTKLRELEMAYGQFGRNVGNYTSAFDEFKKVTVTVGGVAREFNSVRDASRQLTQELKGMVIQGKEGTKEYNDLAEAVHKFEMELRRAESATNDLKTSTRAMDELLDMAESFAALGQISKGFSAIFGFDDNEIERSIQKLVALQSVLNGIEKLRQQMNTQEGIGKILARGNTYIDSFIGRLTGAKLTTDGLTASSKAATVAVRGLSLALKTIGVGIAIGGIALLLKAWDDISEGMNSADVQARHLESSLNTLNASIQSQRDLLASQYMKGLITDEQYLAKQYELENESLTKQIDLLRERAAAETARNESWIFSNVFDNKNVDFSGQPFKEQTVKASSYVADLKIVVKTLQDVDKEWRKCNEAVKENKDYLDKYGKTAMDWLHSTMLTVRDTETAMRGLGNIRLSDFISRFSDVKDQFKQGSITAEEYGRRIGELAKEMNSNEIIKSVVANLDQYIPSEGVRKQVESILGEIRKLDDAFNMTSPQQVHYWNQVRIEGMADGWKKTKAQIDEEKRYEIQQNGRTKEQIDLINKKYLRKEIEARKAYRNEVSSLDNEIARLRIANMEEGLAKQIALLEQERKEKVEKARIEGKRVGEITLEVNKEYDKKILDAKREWAYNVQKVYTDMWNNIFELNHTQQQRYLDNVLQDMENTTDRMKEKLLEQLTDLPTIYGQLGTQVSKRYTVGESLFKSAIVSDEEIDATAEYLRLIEDVRSAEAAMFKAEMEGSKDIERLKDELVYAKDALEEYYYANRDMINVFAMQDLEQEGFTADLSKQFDIRLSKVQEYYNNVSKLSKEYADETLRIEQEKIKENFNNELRNLRNSYAQEDKELEDHLRKGELTREQYNEIVERLTNERGYNEVSITAKYANEIEKAELEHTKRMQEIEANSHMVTIEEFRDFYSHLSSISSEDITYASGILNPFKTRDRNNELIGHYKTLAEEITKEMAKLKIALEMKNISFENYQQAIRELTSLKTALTNTVNEIASKNKELTSKVLSQISQIGGQLASALSNLISAYGEYQDQQYENQLNDLEKFIDGYEERLNELKDIIEEHNSNVNTIEDELSNARGARRQALIDQLNAEKIAQRQALQEEKKLEKEKAKLEEEKDKLDQERNRKQQKIALTTAIIQGAAATANALATQPIWLGISLAALVAAMSGVQIATIKSQKYADGGVIQGRSHSQGGVKVLGGQAEVEGGEMIVNKRTTSTNQDLLYYINSKRKKLSLDDFIDFYSNGKIQTNVRSVSNKFANGGQLPMMRTDINVNDRLLSAFDSYSRRPVVVEVTEIMDKMRDVTEVRTLAGLS